MSKHSTPSFRIPSVLSLPEKISAIVKKLLKLRLSVIRVFSGRDIAFASASLLLLVLLSILRPFAAVRTLFCLLLAVLALIPVVLAGFKQIQNRIIPWEPVLILLSTALAVLLKEYDAGVLIPALESLLGQIQAYVLLHRDAELEQMKEMRTELRNGPEKCDVEKSRHGAVIASSSLCFFAVFIMTALIFAMISLFHLPEAGIWLKRALVMMTLASPVSAICSADFLHFAVFCSAAKGNTAFLDDRVPEEYAACRMFAFSKTGTVTDGKFIISEIAPVGISEEELLRIAALAECHSRHPIAVALKRAAGLPEEVTPEGLMDVHEIPGKGVSALFSGRQIYVGNAALLENHGVWASIPSKSGSAIHVAVDTSYRGYIMVSDTLRERAFDALEELRAEGANMLVMLTGDVRSAARSLASSLNFDMVKPELTPSEKASAVRYLRSVHGEKAHIVCVGDGVDDGEMFQQSDIAVCMSTEQAGTAEVNIYSDEILDVPKSFRICRKARRMLIISLSAILAAKLILCILTTIPIMSVGLTVILDFMIGAASAIYALTGFSME